MCQAFPSFAPISLQSDIQSLFLKSETLYVLTCRIMNSAEKNTIISAYENWSVYWVFINYIV